MLLAPGEGNQREHIRKRIEPEAVSSASDVVLAETLEVRCVWTYLALTFLNH